MATTLAHLIYFAFINLAIGLLGYIILKRKMVFASWLMLMVTIIGVYLIFRHEHPILKMLAIIATTFTAMKVIAATEDYKNKPLTLTFMQWLAFAIGWAGMRAQPFEKLGAASLPNGWPMVRFGISRVIAGSLLILLARYITALPLDTTITHITVSILLLIGFSLILHFGMLGISAGMWRFSGVNTYFLFKSPAKATSLTEFWGKRWNLAFSEMTALTIFRPLKSKIGVAGALMLAFMFSGLLHELALSVPVNNGYGLPMLYFFIQGVLVLLEKVLNNKRVIFLQHSVLAHIWTLFWVIAPAPLLFHTEFITKIIWPMAGLKF
jgi:hypothetical protein